MAYLPGLGDCYGYVEGYRYWLWDNTEHKIASLVEDICWSPHQVLEAKGGDLTLPKLRLLEDIYGPGIYAYKSRPVNNGDWSWTVFGRVALWGKIVEHEDGYRAQFAYPIEFLELNDRIPDSIIPGHFLSIQDLTRLYLTPPGENSCKSETQLELIQSHQFKFLNRNYLRKLKWKKQE